MAPSHRTGIAGRERRPLVSGDPGTKPAGRRFAFRYLALAVLLVAGLAAALVATRAQLVRGADLLPVAFEHLDHTDEQCVLCHHNFEDDTGFDSCYSCHKHDQSVALEIESMFHDFCRDCHIEKAQAGKASGPFRVCTQCHNESGRMSQNLRLRKP